MRSSRLSSAFISTLSQSVQPRPCYRCLPIYSGESPRRFHHSPLHVAVFTLRTILNPMSGHVAPFAHVPGSALTLRRPHVTLLHNFIRLHFFRQLHASRHHRSRVIFVTVPLSPRLIPSCFRNNLGVSRVLSFRVPVLRLVYQIILSFSFSFSSSFSNKFLFFFFFFLAASSSATSFFSRSRFSLFAESIFPHCFSLLVEAMFKVCASGGFHVDPLLLFFQRVVVPDGLRSLWHSPHDHRRVLPPARFRPRRNLDRPTHS